MAKSTLSQSPPPWGGGAGGARHSSGVRLGGLGLVLLDPFTYVTINRSSGFRRGGLG